MAKAIQMRARLIRRTAFCLAFIGIGFSKSVYAEVRDIEEIHFSGVSSFSPEEIQSVVEIQPGVEYNDEQIEKTKSAIASYYQMRGFERVKVQSRFMPKPSADSDQPLKSKVHLDTVLEFVVEEGLPSRVSEVRVEPTGLNASDALKYWDQYRSSLEAKVGVKVGDIYDQEKLTNGRRQIQEALAIDDYVGAKVLDIQVETSSPLAQLAGLPASSALVNRWVSVIVRVDLGDRVSFGFRNFEAFSPTQLQGFIQEQRQQGFGTDYLKTITLKIEEQYHLLGYAFFKVQTYIQNSPEAKSKKQEAFGGSGAKILKGMSKHITFDLQEGPRVLIDQVRFDGNLFFSHKELRAEFFKRATAVLQSGYFVDKDITAAGELLTEWLRSKGFLSSKIVTIDKKFKTSLEAGRKTGRDVAEKDRVDLTVFIYEGEQTFVRSIGISGHQVFSLDEIKKILTVTEDQPLNLYTFSDGIEILKQRYRDRGYLGMRVSNESSETVVKYGQENRAADIDVQIDEGPQYRVSRVEIEGLQKTLPVVVTRQLEFQEGGVLEETKLLETEKNLRRLGLFSAVTIKPLEDLEKPGFKVVKVILQEGSPGVVAGGVGFRNDLGFRLFGQIGYDNLWDENHSASFSLIGNRRIEPFRFAEYEAQMNYIWPWFIFDRVNFRPIATFSRTQYIQFDSDSQSLSINLDRRIWKDPEITAILSYTAEHINQFNAPELNPIENQELTLLTITPALKLDSRDNPLSPTTGWYWSTSYDITSDRLGSRGKNDKNEVYLMSFTRFQTRLDRFVNLGGFASLFLSARFGYERNDVPIGQDAAGNPKPLGRIPLIKQFSLGGVGSLRGFREQSLNYYDQFAITGSIGYSNYRMQLDLPFTGAMKIGPFLDAGTLTLDRFSFYRGLRYGAGAGLHYQTPVGPVNFDWGFNLHPEIGEPPYQIYFSIGVI